MNAIKFDALATIPTGCVLGEGPVWDDRTGSLWLTDIQRAELLRIDWSSSSIDRFALPERLGALALTETGDRLLCAFASGFGWFEPATGAVDWLARTEPVYRGVRMNDGRVDRQGRFWCGSMVEQDDIAPPERGTLYRLDGADPAAPVAVFDGISISNSICFSPAGDLLYFTDTPDREIVCFEVDGESGALTNRRTFAQLADPAFPDGSDVDAEGRVWNAEWGSGRVTAYEPDGSIFAQVDLPVSQATCIAFGGPDLDLLFVTSAHDDLSAGQLASEPGAGDVFVFRTPVRGLPAPRFGVGLQ